MPCQVRLSACRGSARTVPAKLWTPADLDKSGASGGRASRFRQRWETQYVASLLHCRFEALICPYEAVVVNRESAYAATSVAVHPLYNITRLYNYIVDT